MNRRPFGFVPAHRRSRRLAVLAAVASFLLSVAALVLLLSPLGHLPVWLIAAAACLAVSVLLALLIGRAIRLRDTHRPHRRPGGGQR